MQWNSDVIASPRATEKSKRCSLLSHGDPALVIAPLTIVRTRARWLFPSLSDRVATWSTRANEKRVLFLFAPRLFSRSALSCARNEYNGTIDRTADGLAAIWIRQAGLDPSALRARSIDGGLLGTLKRGEREREKERIGDDCTLRSTRLPDFDLDDDPWWNVRMYVREYTKKEDVSNDFNHDSGITATLF